MLISMFLCSIGLYELRDTKNENVRHPLPLDLAPYFLQRGSVKNTKEIWVLEFFAILDYEIVFNLASNKKYQLR